MKLNSVKKMIFSSAFSIMIILNLINLVSATDLVNSESDIIFEDEKPFFKIEDGIIQNEKKIIVSSEKSLIVKDAEDQLQITLPKGTDVIDYSKSDLDIVFEDFEMKTINLTKSQDLFIPFNYGYTIDGTQQYTLKIYFNETIANEITNFNYYYNNYSIDWGNDKVIMGKEIPLAINYTYAKPGKYNITLSLIDEKGVKYSFTTNHTFAISTAQYITFWTIENKNPLAFTMSGTIASIVIFGIAFTETGKYKILALLTLSIPLVTQSHKEDVLDQFVRGQIYGFIKTHPGSHYNELMRELDIKNGTLSYHLYVLEKTGIIKSRKENIRYRAFYPTEMSFPEEERYRLTDLQINILQLIQTNAGTNQKQIAKKLNEKHQTISYNIKVLEQAGLIYVYKKGRKSQCYLNKENTENLTIFKDEQTIKG